MSNKNIETQKPTEEKIVEPLKGEGLSQLVHRLHPKLTARECYKGALVLAKHNNIPNPDLIKFGQKIKIPENFEKEIKKSDTKVEREARKTIEKKKKTLKKFETDEKLADAEQKLKTEFKERLEKMNRYITERLSEQFEINADLVLDSIFLESEKTTELNIDQGLEGMRWDIPPLLAQMNFGLSKMIDGLFGDSPDIARRLKEKMQFRFDNIRYDSNNNAIIVEGFTDLSGNKRDYEIIRVHQEQHKENGVTKQELTFEINQLFPLSISASDRESKLFVINISREKTDEISKTKLTINGKDISEVISPSAMALVEQELEKRVKSNGS